MGKKQYANPIMDKQPSVSSMLTRAAQQNGCGIATIDHFTQRKRTWSEVLDRVSRLAQALKDTYNVKHGDRIGLVSLNSDRYFELFFAASFAGGVIVPTNIRLAPAEMVEQFNDCQAKLVFVDDAFFATAGAQIQKQCKSVVEVIFAGEKRPEGYVKQDYEELIATHAPMPQPDSRGGNDTFGIFYTGGTTGKCKGVELTHQNIYINALGHVGMVEYTQHSKYLHSAPMFHLADGASTFGVTMSCGTHVFLPKFVPDDVLDVIAEHRVNRAMMVPVMIAMMLQSKPTGKERDLTCLENVLYGASPMPQALMGPALKMFPNAKFRQGYGMTETSPAITTLAPEYHDENNSSGKMLSVGQAVSWVEVKIIDATGNELPRGKVGEIATRGPHVMKGYFGMAEQTKKCFTADGFFRTQDGGYMDEDGFVFIVDRLKDMIITGGENVYSAEVENAVMSFPGIAQCAVVGVPDATYVEIVAVVLVLKPDAAATFDQKQLIQHCRDRIAGYKVPRRVIVWEQLPISGAGKILKNKIREQLGTDALGNAVKA